MNEDVKCVSVPVEELRHLLSFIPEKAAEARVICEWFIKGRPDPLADNLT